MKYTCEKCWSEAYSMAIADTSKTQTEHYDYLLYRNERACTSREQAGQFWDKDNQCDVRDLTQDKED